MLGSLIMEEELDIEVNFIDFEKEPDSDYDEEFSLHVFQLGAHVSGKRPCVILNNATLPPAKINVSNSVLIQRQKRILIKQGLSLNDVLIDPNFPVKTKCSPPQPCGKQLQGKQFPDKQTQLNIFDEVENRADVFVKGLSIYFLW